MLKVLLTSIGGLVAPDIINTLRKDANQKIYIVGIDAKRDAIGFKFVDKFFTVPLGTQKNYIPSIKKIIKNEKIDIVVPFADEEVIALSKNKDKLEFLGTKILCNDYETTLKTINKGNLLTFLSKKEFPTPRFFLPKTKNEVKVYAKNLGYPKTSFVIKPALGRGGRGFTVVSQKTNFFQERDRYKVRLDRILEELKLLRLMPDILMMEYLRGNEYSVDVLADKGKVIYAIPRKRIETTFGPSLKGEFNSNQTVIEIIKKIVKIFQLDLISNIQLKYRDVNNSSYPYITEINPRPGGTIALNSRVGVPLLLYGIKLVLDKPFPRNKKIKPIRFWRFYQEYYEKI